MATIITCVVLVIVIILAMVKIIRDGRNKESNCNGDCSSCNGYCRFK